MSETKSSSGSLLAVVLSPAHVTREPCCPQPLFCVKMKAKNNERRPFSAFHFLVHLIAPWESLSLGESRKPSRQPNFLYLTSPCLAHFRDFWDTSASFCPLCQPLSTLVSPPWYIVCTQPYNTSSQDELPGTSAAVPCARKHITVPWRMIVLLLCVSTVFRAVLCCCVLYLITKSLQQPQEKTEVERSSHLLEEARK